jgi:hypothetical protein
MCSPYILKITIVINIAIKLYETNLMAYFTAVFVLTLFVFLLNRAKDIGRDVMDDLRRKEIEKWGARAAKA